MRMKFPVAAVAATAAVAALGRRPRSEDDLRGTLDVNLGGTVFSVQACLAALEASPPPVGTHDRIEHNALCLPDQVPRLAALGASDDRELARRLGLGRSDYEGPTGILGILHHACSDAGLPSASFWAAVPHYIAAAPQRGHGNGKDSGVGLPR